MTRGSLDQRAGFSRPMMMYPIDLLRLFGFLKALKLFLTKAAKQ